MTWKSIIFIIAIILSGIIYFSPEPSAPNTSVTPIADVSLRESVAGAGGFSEDDLTVIREAAHRNHCYGDNFYLLLAIKKAENGKAGREFGIENPRCDAIMAERPADTLDIQAGWAAASIVKTRNRYIDAGGDGVIGDEFIEYMAKRYCPPIGDGSNHENWKRNVGFWFEKLKKRMSNTEEKRMSNTQHGTPNTQPKGTAKI